MTVRAVIALNRVGSHLLSAVNSSTEKEKRAPGFFAHVVTARVLTTSNYYPLVRKIVHQSASVQFNLHLDGPDDRLETPRSRLPLPELVVVLSDLSNIGCFR